ncbi:hypothetical protein NE619_15935, partial [Anaerovorax odorimutans]|nr:hypothetical protein [Anaerovorax odorimutans]
LAQTEETLAQTEENLEKTEKDLQKTEKDLQKTEKDLHKTEKALAQEKREKQELLQNLAASGMSPQQIAQASKLPLETVNRYLKD